MNKSSFFSIFVILIISICLTLAIWAGAFVFSHIFAASIGSSITYTVEVEGFDTVNQTPQNFTIYVPLPYVGTVPAFPKDSFEQSTDYWNIQKIHTKHGDMLKFTSLTPSPKNLNFEISQSNIAYSEILFQSLNPKNNPLELLPMEDGNSVIYIPEPINESLNISILFQVRTPKDLKTLLSGRITTFEKTINGIIPKNTNGCLLEEELFPLPPLPRTVPILIDQPKGAGINDYTLSRNGTAVPGHRVEYEYSVSPDTKELLVAVSSENMSDSLELIVISPDSHILGPYSDNYDQIINNIIPLKITSQTVLAGNWKIAVLHTGNTSSTLNYVLHIREYS